MEALVRRAGAFGGSDRGSRDGVELALAFGLAGARFSSRMARHLDVVEQRADLGAPFVANDRPIRRTPSFTGVRHCGHGSFSPLSEPRSKSGPDARRSTPQ
jgi:hypothetical protein